MATTKVPARPVLIVDDEEPVLTAVDVSLSLAGITNVILCSDSTDVEALLDEHQFCAISLDLVMPKISGMELLPLIRERQPDATVVVMTGTGDVETAIDLMKRGVFDYLQKPVDKHRLVTTIQRAIENWEIRTENAALGRRLLANELTSPDAFRRILTADEGMKRIFSYIEAIAPTSLPLLITGETGVGKELLAQSVHVASGRSGAFVPVNTAGLDDLLFSDTLFGHRKGAFTDASSDRSGMVTRAAGGTLFLDEIGDLSPESQTKLLRIVQEREFYPLGSDLPEQTDARFVFATNRDLDSMIETGQFRQDLYYRLRSHRVVLPPLRDRAGDIPLLLDFFLERAAQEIGKPKPVLPGRVCEYLSRFEFPGNIRELQGLAYDALVRHHSGPLTPELFGSGVQRPNTANAVSARLSSDGLFASMEPLPSLKSASDELISEALRRADGNQTLAAELLGMTRTALNKRLNRRDRSS